MGIIDRLFSRKQVTAGASAINNSAFFQFGQANYGKENQSANVTKYATLDDVYSIVRMIAKTAAMIPIRVYRVKNMSKLKEYDYASKRQNFSTQQLLKKQMLKVQALEEVNYSDELQGLLDNPNPQYTKNEFLEGFYTMRLITGNAYIYTPKIDLGVNTGKVSEMWLMPSQYTNPIISNTFPQSVIGYELRMAGIMQLSNEEVLHSRYFNPQFSVNGDELIGLSPLSAIHRTTERSRAENNFMVRGFQNAGAQGIVNFESAGDDEKSIEVLGAMKSSFYNEASGAGAARKSLFHAGKTSFTQIGLGPVDMQVIESQKITFKKICNAYGVSDVLFNNGEAATESNVNEMIKRLYTNAALPEVYALRDLINQNITGLYSTEYYVDIDLAGITELQDDMAQMANIFSTLPIMNPNMILEAFNYGKSDDPLMDQYYIKSGYTAIQDLAPITDLPITGDYAKP
jgi:HK97 family phage portal protein